MDIWANALLFFFLILSWLYRIKPSVTHEPFHPRVPRHERLVSEFNQMTSSVTPTQLRWKPVDTPDSPTDFIDGLYTLCGAGSSFIRHGYAVHMYVYLPWSLFWNCFVSLLNVVSFLMFVQILRKKISKKISLCSSKGCTYVYLEGQKYCSEEWPVCVSTTYVWTWLVVTLIATVLVVY